MAERHRIAGQKRWEGLDEAQRKADSQIARDNRRTKAQRLRALEDELASLRDVPERIAAIEAELSELIAA